VPLSGFILPHILEIYASTLDKIPQIVKSMMAVANTFYDIVRGMILKPEKTAMYP